MAEIDKEDFKILLFAKMLNENVKGLTLSELSTREVAWNACMYAKEVLQRRWPAAEPVIKMYPKSAYHYAKYVVKDRWEPGEDVIREDPIQWEMYMDDVVKEDKGDNIDE